MGDTAVRGQRLVEAAYIVCTRSFDVWSDISAHVQAYPEVRGKALRDVPTHALVMYGLEDVPLAEPAYYFETLKGAPWGGPYGMSRLTGWLHDDRRRWARAWRVPLDNPAVLERKWDKSVKQTGVWTYETEHVLGAFLWRRLGLPMTDTPMLVICSEGVSRVLDPDVDMPHLAGVPAHDYILPWHLQRTCRRLKWEETHIQG